jgi:environmental stress-induced protein Ves
VTVLLRAAERAPTPWSNGFGSTTEVARSSFDPFAWRISIATIDHDVPFSSLPGLDRILMPFAEGGMRLLVNGAIVHLAQFEPFTFAGEDIASAIDVNAESLDLNVMIRRCDAIGSLRRSDVHAAMVVQPPRGPEDAVVIVVLSGLLSAEGRGLLRHDGVLLTGQAVELVGDGVVAVIRVRTEVSPSAREGSPLLP